MQRSHGIAGAGCPRGRRPRGLVHVAVIEQPLQLALGERPPVHRARDVVLRQQQSRLTEIVHAQRRGAMHGGDARHSVRGEPAGQLDLGVDAPGEPPVALEGDTLVEHERRVRLVGPEESQRPGGICRDMRGAGDGVEPATRALERAATQHERGQRPPERIVGRRLLELAVRPRRARASRRSRGLRR